VPRRDRRSARVPWNGTPDGVAPHPAE
jgi:hypothetical protein